MNNKSQTALSCIRLALISISIALLIFNLLWLTVETAYSAEAPLNWTPNSETDFSGYRVYSRPAQGAYDYDNPVWDSGGAAQWDADDPACTILGVDDSSTTCFVVRAYNRSGAESGDSNEVCRAPNPYEDTPPMIISPANDEEAVTLTPELLVENPVLTGDHV